MTVEIARAEGIRHRSSSRMFWRRAGPLAQSGGADERVRGFLIKRRGPLNTVALLERRKRPLCLWAHHAIERATVESLVMKLYLRPPDVVFGEISGVYPMVRVLKQRWYCSCQSTRPRASGTPRPGGNS